MSSPVWSAGSTKRYQNQSTWCTGVFILHAGAAGIGWPSLAVRGFSAVVISWLCFKNGSGVLYQKQWLYHFPAPSIRQILRIAIPNGLEDGIFQLVKVGLSGIVALFGMVQIAANGVAQSIWSFAALAGFSMAPIFIAVIGQCTGLQDIEAARWYLRKLLWITLLYSIVWNGLVLALTPQILKLYPLSPDHPAGHSPGGYSQCIQCAAFSVFRGFVFGIAGSGECEVYHDRFDCQHFAGPTAFFSGFSASGLAMA